MNIVALIPFWSDYQSSDGEIGCRPLVSIGGKSLVNRTIEIINHIRSIKEVVIFASNDKVLDYLDGDVRYRFLKRDKYLDSENASIEDIIESFLSGSDADIIVLIHPKSPFIKSETIQECIEKVTSLDFDSAFVANSIRKHAWFKGEPLNYSRNGDTPSLPNIHPILVETASVYVFTSELFKNERRRIGQRPYVKEVGHFEGFEIDRDDDFEIAELIINAGLERERS
jgi:CMP-N-acetylneuraminic acid synthetase